MKTKQKKELQAKNINELTLLLKDSRDLLSNIRLDKTQNKLKNTRQIFIKRKEIAQILTIIREKELQEKIKK